MLLRLSFYIFIVWSLSVGQLQAKELTEEITIYSDIAQQDLTFSITLPSGYKSEGKVRYPAFYSVSGKSRLEVLKAQVNWLSHVGFAPLPKVLFISLPTIKGDKLVKASGSLYSLTTQVYEKEVIPYIEKKYLSQPFRIIEGFSSNANQLLSIFLNKPELFNAYMIFSPALGLDKSQLVDRLMSQKISNRYKQRSLYLSLGSFEENRLPFEKIQTHFESWPQNKINGIKIITEDFSHRNYLTSPILGLTNAIEGIFSDLQPAAKLFEKTGITGVKQHFFRLNKKYGYELSSDNTIINLGFHYAKIKQFNKAEAALNSLIKHSPENIIFLLRLSEIQQQAKLTDKANTTLHLALHHAKSQKNVEASNFIESRIAALK